MAHSWKRKPGMSRRQNDDFEGDEDNSSEHEVTGSGSGAGQRQRPPEGDSDLDDQSGSDSDSGVDQESDQDIDSERTAIRQELSSLSFAELEALKSKIGTKEWNEAMFGGSSSVAGQSSKKKKKLQTFKRDNKNRPRELSSKIRVPRIRQVVPVQKRISRDPRFESLCGEMNEQIWSKNYEFIDEIRKKEQEDLRAKMQKEDDNEKRAAIKQTLQKLINKDRSDAVKKEKEDKKRTEREENIRRLKEGKKPYYMKKSTKKYMELADKYDELKSSGKLEGYLKKKRQKNAIRDKKTLKLPKSS